MKFEPPLFVIWITGNKRDECSKLGFVCFAAYQQSSDLTVVFVRVSRASVKEQKSLHLDLITIFAKIGTVESCEYRKSGIEVFLLSGN